MAGMAGPQGEKGHSKLKIVLH